MFCGVCETRRDDEAAKFCVQCAKLMCDECAQHHSHVFFSEADPGRSRDHEVSDLGEILRFFEAESKLHAAQSNEAGGYICEQCNDRSCERCVEVRRRERRVRKVRKYTPQIQSALVGCQNMIEAKESALSQLLNEVSHTESQVLSQMKQTDEMIHQATNEILFRIATALRKRESLIKKTAKAPFHDRLQRCRGVGENARSVLRVLESARGVVTEHRSTDSVAMNKDLFSRIRVLNKLDVSFVRGNTDFAHRLPSTDCLRPSDKEVNGLCEQILKVASGHRTKHSWSGNRILPLGDADDEMSIGETDEDFGEFHVIGNPQQVNRITKPRGATHGWQQVSRTTAHQHVTGDIVEARQESPNTKHRSHPKSLRDDMLHGISTKRTDSGTASSSGRSYKSVKASKSGNSHRSRKHNNEGFSVRSTSHPDIYKTTNGVPAHPAQNADDLRSQSTGNLVQQANHVPEADIDKPSRSNRHRSPDRRGDGAAAKSDRPRSGRSSPEKRHARKIEFTTTSNSNAPKPKPRSRQARNDDVTPAAHDVRWQPNPHLPSFVYFSDVHKQMEAAGNGTPRKLSYVPRTLLMGGDLDELRNRKKSFPIQRPSRAEYTAPAVVRSGRGGRVALDNPMLVSTPL